MKTEGQHLAFQGDMQPSSSSIRVYHKHNAASKSPAACAIAVVTLRGIANLSPGSKCHERSSP